MKKKELNTSRFFDTYSKKYNIKQVNKYFKKNILWFIKNLPQFEESQKIIDVGCGPGMLCKIIAAENKNIYVHGLDISTEMIKKAQEQCDKIDNIKFMVGNAHSIEIDSNSYDYIFNTISFHHYENPQKVLSEFYRILKPNGKLYLMDSITDPIFTSFMPLVWDLTEKHKCYTKHLSSNEFKKLFNESEFSTVEFDFYTRFFPARHILCIAKK